MALSPLSKARSLPTPASHAANASPFTCLLKSNNLGSIIHLSVQGAGFRVQGSGFRAQGSGFRVQGLGFRVALTCHW